MAYQRINRIGQTPSLSSSHLDHETVHHIVDGTYLGVGQAKCSLPEILVGYDLHVQMIIEVSDSVFFGRVLPVALAELKALSNTIPSSVERIEAVVATSGFDVWP